MAGTCPKGPAWADKAYSKDKAHSMVECSNGGICDRSMGACQCFSQYTGSACQRCEWNNCSTFIRMPIWSDLHYDLVSTRQCYARMGARATASA